MTPPNSGTSDARALGAEVLITLGGVTTSLAIVAINQLILQKLGVNLLSLSYWFVLPAGGLIGGAAAASGYYATARMTHTMPSRLLMLNMVAIGVSTWILSKWVPYVTLELDDGTRLADAMPFVDYIESSARHARLTLGTRGRANLFTTGELGDLGYAREAMQLLGFVGGGGAVHLFLRNVEACKPCKRYAKSRTLLKAVSPAAFSEAMQEVDIGLPDLVDDAESVLEGKRLIGLSLFLFQCPKCRREWFRPAVVYPSGNSEVSTNLRRYEVDRDLSEALVASAAKRGRK
jgi:hypothetical protein